MGRDLQLNLKSKSQVITGFKNSNNRSIILFKSVERINGLYLRVFTCQKESERVGTER